MPAIEIRTSTWRKLNNKKYLSNSNQFGRLFSAETNKKINSPLGNNLRKRWPDNVRIMRTSFNVVHYTIIIYIYSIYKSIPSWLRICIISVSWQMQNNRYEQQNNNNK